MRRLTALVAIAVAAVGVATGSGGAASQPSANGNGSIGFQNFSFSARGVGFGAGGHVTVTNPNTDPNTVTKGRVNCLMVINNQAYMSGNIVSISPAQNPAFAPTDFLAFAEDNGEPGDFRDRWSFASFTPSSTFNPSCLNPFSLFGSLVTSGNIDVNPTP
jgi:hypothetical protein